MKPLATVTLLACSLGLSAFAADASPKAREAVIAAEKAWVDAMMKADKSALEKLYADDLAYAHSNAKVETKAENIKAVTEGANKYVSITFTDSTYRQYGGVVVSTHRAEIKGSQSGVANLYVSHVWVNQGGKWQMANRHTTRLPQ